MKKPEIIKTIGIVVAVICLIGGAVWYSNSKEIKLDNIDLNQKISANSQNGEIADHVYSDNNSKVILIEYGDYQCPSCGNMSPKIKKLAEEYKDKIQVIFRNFPLDGHQNALSAASAAEAAGLQGKYAEMHDLLFEKQDEWGYASGTKRTELYLSYAKELGLDENKFKEDMASDRVKAKINFDKAIGAKIKLTGTPSFYLNGESLDSGTWSDETKLREKIDSLLNK